MSIYPFQGQIINNELRKIYTSTLRTLFDNINYYVSKKNTYYEEIKETTNRNIEEIGKLSENFMLDADKHFIIMYKSLTVENYKLAKNFFPSFKILIKNSFITGSTPINQLNMDINMPQYNESDDIIKYGKTSQNRKTLSFY